MTLILSVPCLRSSRRILGLIGLGEAELKQRRVSVAVELRRRLFVGWLRKDFGRPRCSFSPYCWVRVFRTWPDTSSAMLLRSSVCNIPRI